jgi:hypothetical protein
MRPHRHFLPIGILVSILLVPLPGLAQDATPTATGSHTVVASGLTNPRGFAWGPDGEIYLALAGSGGTNQVSVGGTPYPFFGGDTSSIVKLVDGCPVDVATGLPSGIWTDPGWVWGIMDVAFLNGTLYALSGGGGGSWGNPSVPNGVYQVNDDGTTSLVANLSEWLTANPTSFIPPDYDPEGSLFDLEAGTDRLYVSEAVGGRVIEVAVDGTITLLADLSAGHMVPTGLALAPDGGVYVGYETTIPYPEGGSKVSHIASDGTVTDAWTGLTAVTDVVVGPDGTIYAAEMSASPSSDPPYLMPGTGRIVKQTGPDSLEVVVDAIDAPVFLGFSPDGDLYVDGPAFGANDGEGWFARVDLDGGIGTPSATTEAPTCSMGTPSA